MASLQIPSKSRFVDAVGEDVAEQFAAFLAARPGSMPRVSMYPGLFRTWALLHHPALAVPGTTALAGMLLEPLGAASVALLGYENGAAVPPRPGRSPDWDQSYDDLATNLDSSPSREFSVTSATLVSNVTNTWAHGEIGNHAGLWDASSPTSEQAETFATSNFELHVSIGHVLLFRPVPGAWYSSAVLDIAHSTPQTPPWAPGSPLDWDSAFGSNGLLRNITTGLIIVDSLRTTIRSAGPYSDAAQETILNNQANGLWPFYMTNGAQNTCLFTQDGALEIHAESEPGVPVLIGAVVASIETYLGHHA